MYRTIVAAMEGCTQQPPTTYNSRLQPPAMMAKKLNNRMAKLAQDVDAEKLYEPQEAIALMKKLANTKFAETAELHGNLNLDPKYNDQQIRTTVALPHGTGKSVRVAVLADGPAADAAVRLLAQQRPAAVLVGALALRRHLKVGARRLYSNRVSLG